MQAALDLRAACTRLIALFFSIKMKKIQKITVIYCMRIEEAISSNANKNLFQWVHPNIHTCTNIKKSSETQYMSQVGSKPVA